jgi:hypothetical protein
MHRNSNDRCFRNILSHRWNLKVQLAQVQLAEFFAIMKTGREVLDVGYRVLLRRSHQIEEANENVHLNKGLPSCSCIPLSPALNCLAARALKGRTTLMI